MEHWLLTTRVDNNKTWNIGFNVATNRGRHYQTMEDLLGASTFHNINSYALGTYDIINPYVQYDLNTMGTNGLGKLVYEGDKFGYDYALHVNKGYVWSNYSVTTGRWHLMVAGKMGGIDMKRKGYMRNGMFADNSYGNSGRAKFGEAGGKGSISLDAGRGHVFKIGMGYEWRAPLPTTAFVSPEMNNDFVQNLKDEHVFSADFGYQYQNAWVHANLNAYYSRLDHVTEWQNFYFDDINSFSYVSLTNIRKAYYGVEMGLSFKVSSSFSVKAIGTISEGKNVNNANVRYMSSTKATYTDDVVMNKGMHEASTPLTAAGIILDYHSGGWFIDLKGNYYDRIYLSYSPSYRYCGTLTTMGSVDNEGNFIVPEQSEGKGGFMLDGSIGKSIRMKRGKQLSINLSVTNLLNKRDLCTGGYEQSRSDYTVKSDGTMNNQRAYKFSLNPKKYYAFGINGMLNLTFRF